MVIDTELLLRLIVAAIAGGIVGFERSRAGKPAGIRTQMLVCMGAALFVLVTIRTIPGEAARIIAGIATGVGFLGAGSIFKAKDHVVGLTTAATIWVVAAIGITAGLGEYALAATTTVLVLLILQLIRLEFFREH